MSVISPEREAHSFALWVPEIDSVQESLVGSYTLTDRELLFRIRRVLRLKPNDCLILFASRLRMQATVTALTESSCIVTCHSIAPLHPIHPLLHVYLPLLEKASLEEALRRATVLGVTSVRFLVTEKTKRDHITPTERERLQRIMIAAAEQSKQFVLPRLVNPVALQQITIEGMPISFDADGVDFYTAPWFASRTWSEATVLLGPEGDFTGVEKKWLSDQQIARYRLFSTILRSEDALMVGIGTLRTCVIQRQ